MYAAVYLKHWTSACLLSMFTRVNGTLFSISHTWCYMWKYNTQCVTNQSCYLMVWFFHEVSWIPVPTCHWSPSGLSTRPSWILTLQVTPRSWDLLSWLIPFVLHWCQPPLPFPLRHKDWDTHFSVQVWPLIKLSIFIDFFNLHRLPRTVKKLGSESRQVVLLCPHTTNKLLL